jgi:hypothetical protein
VLRELLTPHSLNHFINLAFVTSSAFLLYFAPFLYPPSNLLQVVSRIFPFARGLFEDKVANFWCALNVVVKLREMASIATLAKLCLVVTVIAILPGVVSLVWTSYVLGARGGSSIGGPRGVPPTIKLLPHALFVSSMAFFLFSFQVHEKSILLPLWPLTLLLADNNGPGQPGSDWEWSVLMNNVGLFRCVAQQVALSWCCGVFPLTRASLSQHVATVAPGWTRSTVCGFGALLELSDRLQPLRVGSFFRQAPQSGTLSTSRSLSLFCSCHYKLMHGHQLAYSGILGIHTLETISSPPPHLPHLFWVLNLGLSCGIFGLSFLWGLKRQIEEGWALVGLGGGVGGVSVGSGGGGGGLDHKRQGSGPTTTSFREKSPSPSPFPPPLARGGGLRPSPSRPTRLSIVNEPPSSPYHRHRLLSSPPATAPLVPDRQLVGAGGFLRDNYQDIRRVRRKTDGGGDALVRGAGGGGSSSSSVTFPTVFSDSEVAEGGGGDASRPVHGDVPRRRRKSSRPM